MSAKTRFDVLDECPDWPLVVGISPNGGGGMFHPVELFSPDEATDIPTHVHFYMNITRARTVWKEQAHLFAKYPYLQTVSFETITKEDS